MKIKIYVYLKFDNFDIFIKIKVGHIEVKRKIAFVKRKRKFQIKKKLGIKLKKLGINTKSISQFFKYIEIDKLYLNFIIGSPFVFFTVFSIPILSTILELVRKLPVKKFNNYYYIVNPYYNDIKLIFEIESILKIRIYDLIYFFIRNLNLKANNTEN